MWTEKVLKRLQSEGRIVGYKITATRQGRKTLLKKKGKQHYWIEMNLQYWCDERSVDLAREYQFHLHRRWRFDWALPDLKISIEYEGIFSQKSRHTTAKGYTGDAEKYNSAAADGWRILRFTALNYKNLLTQLEDVYRGLDKR